MYTIALRKPMIGLFVGVAMLGTLLNPMGALPAQAQTTSTLQEQIQQLLAQIATLQAQINGSVQSGGYTYNRNLTIGSMGADVTALQQFLISKSHAIPAGATGYFGAQTQSALAKYQAQNGINPPAGYFGPVTRAHVNNLSSTPNNPTPGDTTNDNLSGNAGSVDSYRLTPGYNNEVVGENEEDVEVSGIDIKVNSGSDIRLRSVQLVLTQETANSRFDKYADEVSLWLDGKEIARVDADEFTSRNNWTRTISVDSKSVIKRNETGKLALAISGARNIDSADEGESWNVDFRSIRFTDAQNATITDNPNTGTRSFSFENFASAANVEMRIFGGDESINNARVLNVHATNKTKNVDVMAYNVELKGSSDVTIDSLPVEFSVTGASYLNEMASVAHLYLDGKRVGTESVRTSNNTVIFDDLDVKLRSGKTYEFVVKVDFLPLSSTLNEGQTISASLGETQTNSSDFDAEDESGTELRDSHVRGSAQGGAHIVYDAGIHVSLVSVTQNLSSQTGENNDYGTFVIKYRVEAFDDTVYVALSSAATTTDVTDATIATSGVLYLVDKDETPITDGLSTYVSWKKIQGSPTTSGATNGLRMQAGDIAEFTLSVVRTNSTSGDNAFYYLALKAIGWNTDDSTTYNVYNFDLRQYKTDPLYLN